MRYWALIENDTVVNVIEAGSPEIVSEVTHLEFVEYTLDNPIGIGYVRKGELFEAPTIEE
jgi:hypothetical protein